MDFKIKTNQKSGKFFKIHGNFKNKHVRSVEKSLTTRGKSLLESWVTTFHPQSLSDLLQNQVNTSHTIRALSTCTRSSG